MAMLDSWWIKNGAFLVAAACLIMSQSLVRMDKSHDSSSELLPTPAVRMMTPMPLGMSIPSKAARSSARSSPSMRREMPPARGLLGIKTR